MRLKINDGGLTMALSGHFGGHPCSKWHPVWGWSEKPQATGSRIWRCYSFFLCSCGGKKAVSRGRLRTAVSKVGAPRLASKPPADLYAGFFPAACPASMAFPLGLPLLVASLHPPAPILSLS